MNYPAMAARIQASGGRATGLMPFFKCGTGALVGHEGFIRIPPEAREVHYEGELAVVIGRVCGRVSRAEALDYVLGYTCANDVTEVSWWREDDRPWRAKGSDTWCPVGPWVETAADPAALRLVLRLDGELQNEASTGEMLNDVPTIISELSRYITLYPGDLILTGASGSGPLQRGDVVEVELSGVGVLRNYVETEEGSVNHR